QDYRVGRSRDFPRQVFHVAEIGFRDGYAARCEGDGHLRLVVHRSDGFAAVDRQSAARLGPTQQREQRPTAPAPGTRVVSLEPPTVANQIKSLLRVNHRDAVAEFIQFRAESHGLALSQIASFGENSNFEGRRHWVLSLNQFLMYLNRRKIKNSESGRE